MINLIYLLSPTPQTTYMDPVLMMKQGKAGFYQDLWATRGAQQKENLAPQSNEPWLYFGDLNDTLAEQEKVGGNPRNSSQLSLGRNTVADRGLIDMGFEGHPFTWSNGRQMEDNIQCRLDRAMGNQRLCNRFSPIKISHLPRFRSDHTAILIHLEAPQQRDGRRKTRLFRFEESWTHEEKCEDMIRRCWAKPSRNCVTKLWGLQVIDKVFEEHNLGCIKKDISKLERMLKDNSMWSKSAEDIRRFKEAEKQHAELLKTQETMWRQQSRAVWLRDGDKNNKFFHIKASQRNKVNEIKKLKDDACVWWKGAENVERVLINYFSDLFSSSNPSNVEIICEVVKGKLSEDHRTWCEKEYAGEEVREAIQQMHPLNAPDPDGLPTFF